MKILKPLFLSFLTLIVFSFLSEKAEAAASFQIAATVNKDAISESDVDERIKLLFASSGIRRTPENLAKARPQALNSLVEEQLQVQEAVKQNLAVSDDEVAEGFAGMASQNSMTPEQFELVLSQQGIPKSTILRKVKAQIAWRKVVTSVLRPQIDVTETDVTARLDRLKENLGKTEYLTHEIFLPVVNTAEENETKDLADRLANEIKGGAAKFPMVAAQFSKSGSAGQGGALGWVQEGELPQELDVVMKSLAPNQISPPIRGLAGYYLLIVPQKREVTMETLPSEDDVLNAIGLERLDRLQQRYMADIRSAAFIDQRDAKTE